MVIGHRYQSESYFGIPKTIRFNGLFEKTHNFSREKHHQQFQGTIISMPLKINMEQNSLEVWFRSLSFLSRVMAVGSSR